MKRNSILIELRPHGELSNGVGNTTTIVNNNIQDDTQNNGTYSLDCLLLAEDVSIIQADKHLSVGSTNGESMNTRGLVRPTPLVISTRG